MLSHRPPNLVAASGYLIGGLLIAACFLMTCFPSNAATIQSSISGSEWGVLAAFLLVGLLAVSSLSNVFRVVIQLFSQLAQIGIFAVVVWGGVMLYQNHNRSPATPAIGTTEMPTNKTESEGVDALRDVAPDEAAKDIKSGEWWQDNPYEKE